MIQSHATSGAPKPGGGQCHDSYPDSLWAAPSDGWESPSQTGAVRVITLVGAEHPSEQVLTEAFRDPQVSAPLIVNLTGATLDPEDELALITACIKANDRHQRLVVVVDDAVLRASLYDLGMTSILPLASSEAEARRWLEVDPVRLPFS